MSSQLLIQLNPHSCGHPADTKADFVRIMSCPEKWYNSRFPFRFKALVSSIKATKPSLVHFLLHLATVFPTKSSVYQKWFTFHVTIETLSFGCEFYCSIERRKWKKVVQLWVLGADCFDPLLKIWKKFQAVAEVNLSTSAVVESQPFFGDLSDVIWHRPNQNRCKNRTSTASYA